MPDESESLRLCDRGRQILATLLADVDAVFRADEAIRNGKGTEPDELELLLQDYLDLTEPDADAPERAKADRRALRQHFSGSRRPEGQAEKPEDAEGARSRASSNPKRSRK